MTYGGRGIAHAGPGQDEDAPWAPWSDGRWGVELVFTFDTHGDTASPGPRHIQLTTTGEGRSWVGTVHLGDADHAEGVGVAGPTVTDHLARAIGIDEPWAARFDARSGSVRGKLWRLADGEPARWDVEVPLEDTTDEADGVTLWVRLGDPASEQTVRIHELAWYGAAADGQRVEHEWLGLADGDAATFEPAHRFDAGSLVAHVNGVDVAPSAEDGRGFTLDGAPTARSIIRASYIASEE